MSSNYLLIDELACSNRTRPLVTCDRMLVGLVLWTLVHTTEALAGDQVQPGSDPKHNLNPPRQPTPIVAAMIQIPDLYQATTLSQDPPFSSREFRPRGPSLNEGNAHTSITGEQPLMSNTTVWQRLAHYRSHDRVSLVTLWETGGNSLSLQASKKGDPTLQWTSRLMSRPGSGRGLLDELFSTSAGGVGRKLHFNRFSTTDSATKTSRVVDLGLGGSGTQ